MNPNPNQEKSAVALREEETVSFWKERNLFEKSLNKQDSKGDVVFYDGPPFATGLPHYGHILGGTGKDVIARYKTMQGFRVPRKWGWDTHGLPIETIVEKSLGIISKKQIEEMGLATFAKEARSKVLGFVADWKKTVDRTARWVDFDGSYKTMDTTFIESVWWALGELNNKKLIYEADRILPYCPRCQTPLANAEIAMDNSYKDIVDISVYVKMSLVDHKDTYFLAWTTTPWTLPGNTALAVNSELVYVKVLFESGYYYIGKDRVETVFKDKEYQVVEEVIGKDLVGISYVPPFDYFRNTDLAQGDTAWKVYAGDFVTAETGTGIVHIAPSFGEDDAALAKKYSIPSIKHVASDGTFIAAVTHFAGVQVKPKEDHQAADVEIIKYLAHNHLLFAKEKITHSYPHCYRCETPLLYYGLSSWFIKVQEFKNRMLELNQGINWVPDHLRDGRFKHVLENAPDWNFSRNRFWASPLPIWKSTSGKLQFISSVEDLKKYTKKSGNKYFVMRHGQATNNVEPMHSHERQTTALLTDQGKEEALRSAKNFSEKIDIVIASPFERTKETAQIVCQEIGFPFDDVIFDDRLREWDTSVTFNNKLRSEFSQYYNNDYYKDPNHKFDNNDESFGDVINRAGSFINDIENKYQGKNIFVVTHSGLIRGLEFVRMGTNFDSFIKNGPLEVPKNAEIREVNFVPIPHNENYELDLHRPYIDSIKLEIDGEEYTRIPEVIDCWFESGSMPFAQDHYPFERPDWMEKNFPADFVVEYIAQTRTWFYYTLLVSTILFDRAPFNHIVTTGNLNGTDGQKMSKSKGNYPDPWILMDKYGADALRMYLMSSVLMKGEDSNFMEKTVDDIYKKIILRLENCLSFLDMYEVSKDRWLEGEQSENVLDQWIMARLTQVVAEVTTGFEAYSTVDATKGINLFVDDLSAWYLRRSRDRFKDADTPDRQAAGKTLVTVLVEFSKVIAPVMPFIAETIYQKLRTDSSEESVHLDKWSTFSNGTTDTIEYMKQTRELVTLGLEARSKVNIKVRQPLGKITISKNNLPGEYLEIIKDELNIKEIMIDENNEQGTVVLDTTITEELKNEGDMREFVRKIQDMRKTAGFEPKDRVVVYLTDTEPDWFASVLGDEMMRVVGAEKIIWGSDAKVEKIG